MNSEAFPNPNDPVRDASSSELCSAETPPQTLGTAVAPPAPHGHGSAGAGPGEATELLRAPGARLAELGLLSLHGGGCVQTSGHISSREAATRKLGSSSGATVTGQGGMVQIERGEI